MSWELDLGAHPNGDGTRFRVWAPKAQRVELVLFDAGQPGARHELAPQGEGYFAAAVAGVGAGTRYMYALDGGEPRPDPASRFQPEGVHGPSEVVDPHAYSWQDAGWRGRPLEDLVIYELHVGTATPEGTFASLIGHLDTIKELGATAIELMPVASFPGMRGWGYDGVGLFAPHVAYGGPEGLRTLVDAAHARGLAVLLDVVYNHFGPDGNYLREFSPDYFTDHHCTPWGDAVNTDGPNSKQARDFFIANALHWAHEYHIDGLRLDATDHIIDDGPIHLLAEMAQTVRASLGERSFLFFAETSDNHPHIISPRPEPHEAAHEAQPAREWGLDGVWADEFNHQMRVALTDERVGYFANYSGTAEDLVATIRQGWFYVGQIYQTTGEPRGQPADAVAPPRFVYHIQNHDQVGNRPTGERLHHTIGLDAYRAASTLLLTVPQTPLIWMGQEWAASTPFQYFTDHNEELGRLVTAGRRKEFAYFTAFSGEKVPDPQAESTFLNSKLKWEEREQEPHGAILRLYQELLRLRFSHPAMVYRQRDGYSVEAAGEKAILLRRCVPGSDELLIVVNLGGPARVELPGANHKPLLDSEEPRFGGRGPAGLAGSTLVFEGPGAVVLERVG